MLKIYNSINNKYYYNTVYYIILGFKMLELNTGLLGSIQDVELGEDEKTVSGD